MQNSEHDLEALARKLTSLCAYPLPASVIDTIKQSVAVLRTVQRASVPTERSALREQVFDAIATLRDELEGMPGPQYVAGALYALDNLRDRLALLPPTPGDAAPTCATEAELWEAFEAGHFAWPTTEEPSRRAQFVGWLRRRHQPQPAQPEPSQPERT